MVTPYCFDFGLAQFSRMTSPQIWLDVVPILYVCFFVGELSYAFLKYDGFRNGSGLTSVLEATVTPQGFKVALVNLVSSFKQHATSDATALASAFSKHGATGGCKKLKTLESNCRFLLWANLHNLASKVKSLKIRNPNAVSINMEVSVGKPYHELFQVEMRTENGKHASSTLHLDTNATVDIYVSNAKCSRLLAMGRSFIESRLVIKSYSGSHTDIKNVALYALEGELKVELRDTCCLEKTRHLVDMGVPQAPGTVATYSFTIVNSGDWDAFVYLATDGSPLLGSPKGDR
ncbi:hypothetical protein HPB51_015140 [Rhipicephalus microplus]|uniref:Uncharacterized protein n=1 Tax=Rhipicephalus microplus TaxID=6941 RepID=A0A9J6DNL5_RHIMP|nr:hypothetical protein HPB51_015140 [Rhipicephalus microplus]